MKTYSVAICALLIASGAARADIVLGTNAIRNGNAETGTTAGWSNANFTAEYTNEGGFPKSQTGLGTYYFGGGNNHAFASGSQSVSVSNLSSGIDAGRVSFVMSGALGGYFNQRDYATLQVEFLSGANSILGSDTLGPVTPSDRQDVTELLQRSTTGTLPTGTRSLDFILSMTRFDGDYDDGYADNLSFVASESSEPPPPPPPPPTGTTPEPSSLVLLASGALAAGAALRRRYLTAS